MFEYFLNIFQTPIKDLLNDQDNAVLAAKFRQNAYEFALAKTATFAERSKNSTKEEAQMILAKMFFHNGTEKVQFAMSIQAALEWQEILNDADVFPNLRYQAVGDENTRDSHRALSGIIKPITDAFWDKFYPPIDYRCRCTVRQEKADVKITKDLPKDLPKIPKGLGHNPGKTGQAFNNEHTYFENVEEREMIKKIRTQSIKTARENLVETTVGNEFEINFTVKGIKEAVNQPFYNPNLKNIIIAESLKETLKSAIYIGKEIPKGGKQHLLFLHFYKAKDIENLYFMVEETKDKKYNFFGVTDIKPKNLVD